MATKLLTISLALAIGMSAPAAFADATSSPGKTSAYTSISGVTFPISGSPFQAAVQILKGKKKRVLEVDVTAIDTSSTTDVIGIQARVNGLSILEPSATFQVEHTCTPGSFVNCTAHASYWVDLDTAEAAFPGLIINVPLDITVGVLVANTATTGSISVRARLVKK